MKDHSEIRWRSLWAMVPVSAIVFMDQSILPVALPTIEADFNASGVALQWTVNSYLLFTAIFILLGGKWGDRFGHRLTYLWGIVIFVLSSLVCALSPNVEFLIGARAVQGLGAALMIPAQTSLIAATFPPHARGRATGIIVSLGALFLVLGPAVGGYLTENISWRAIFWINFPLGILAVALAFAILPTSQKGKGAVDLPGFAYFAFFASAITIFFMQGSEWGWRSGEIILAGIVSLISAICLWKREKKAAHPFLDLSLLKRPVFAAVCVSIALTQAILMIAVFRTVYMQEILGYTPAETGLISSISSLPVIFCALIAGFLSDKAGPKLPLALGFLAIIFSFIWLGVSPVPSLASLFTALLMFGVGLPMIFTPSYSKAMSSVPPLKIGVASGMVATLRMFGGTMGLSLIYLFVNESEKLHTPTLGKNGAEIASFSDIHFLLGALMTLTFVTVFYLQNRKSAHQLPNSPSEGWD